MLSLPYYIENAGPAPIWASFELWLKARMEEKREADRSMCLQPQGLCFIFKAGKMVQVTSGSDVVWSAEPAGSAAAAAAASM